uniref:Uncharacterized protein n=1 Tax=Oryza glumipatula TaxID=40148 RepID=A0A0D9ZJZ4_9ORYZ
MTVGGFDEEGGAHLRSASSGADDGWAIGARAARVGPTGSVAWGRVCAVSPLLRGARLESTGRIPFPSGGGDDEASGAYTDRWGPSSSVAVQITSPIGRPIVGPTTSLLSNRFVFS